VPHSGEEFLYLVENCVLVADVGQVVATGQLDVRRIGDRFGEVAPVFHSAICIFPALDDEGRRLDRRQHMSDVCFPLCPKERENRSRAPGKAFLSRPPNLE
jgi:hypothetical protein